MPIDIKLATAKKNLETKSTISSWTKQENHIVDRAIKNITSIEKNLQ